MAGGRRCAICEESIGTSDKYFGEVGTAYESDLLCETCFYEADVCATVVYGRDCEQCPLAITPTRNDTEGEFTCHWVSTGPWRGYYAMESDDWVRVHNDCILAFSRDAENLKEFDDVLCELLAEIGIRYARCFPRTSNVFSSGYELWVSVECEAAYNDLIREVKEEAAERLRDPAAFHFTALTGKDPEECDDRDRLFALVGSMLLVGSR